MVSPKSRISLGALFYCFNIPFYSVKSNEVYLSSRWPTNEICMQLNRLLRVCLALWLSVPVFQNRKPVQNFSWRFKALTSQKYKSCRPGRSVICFFFLKNNYIYLISCFEISLIMTYAGASLVTQTVKNLPAMWETWVQSRGWEDPLEKGMTTLPSILAWRIPWTEEPGGQQSVGLQSRTRLSDYHTCFVLHWFNFYEGNILLIWEK